MQCHVSENYSLVRTNSGNFFLTLQMATLPLIQRGHNMHKSLNTHWWCVLCCLFQLPLSKEDDNSSCWMSPRWAICRFDSWWRPISLASLRANASSVHDIPQLESFLAGFSFPCLVYIACEQALLFGRTKRAAQEHSSERRRPPAPPRLRLLSRASRAFTFHYIPKWRACSQAIDYTAIVSPFHSHGSCFQIRSH